MSDKKSWGETVPGWFIERDEPAEPAPEIPTKRAGRRGSYGSATSRCGQ